MSKVEDLIKQYLPTVNILQLATSYNNLPWACTLHYYSDDNLNLYWLSTVERRHSQDINSNPNVAIAIAIHENTAKEDYVIGMSMEGTAKALTGKIDETVSQGYVNKLHADEDFISDVVDGKDPNKFYKFEPSKIILIDSRNFPKNPRQEFISREP